MRPTAAPPSLPAHLLASDARSRRSQAEHADRAASGTKNTPSFKPTRLPTPPALRRSTQHAHFSRPLTWQLMLYMAVAPSEKIKCVARCPPTDAPLSRPSPCSHTRSALRSPSLRPKVLGRRPRRPRPLRRRRRRLRGPLLPRPRHLHVHALRDQRRHRQRPDAPAQHPGRRVLPHVSAARIRHVKEAA